MVIEKILEDNLRTVARLDNLSSNKNKKGITKMENVVGIDK